MATIERRSAARQPSAERATAHAGPSGGVACIITDVSATGARIGFAAALQLPNRFELTGASTGRSRIVHLVWQRGLVAGVKFNTAPTLRERLSLRAWFGSA